ncbi:hypothetical protein [Aquimarina sp. SS2-1]|uniref:hypothetical protein n=1 Tax=Aquimarina besae TaxID=3342247 RepID=UPI00366E839D
MVANKHPFKREVTHTEYKHEDKKVKKGGWSRIIQNHITENHLSMKEEWVYKKGIFTELNDLYGIRKLDPKTLPIMVGGFFLILLCFYLFIYFDSFVESEPISSFELILGIFFLLGFIFFAIYYFTMPQKECILNRTDGLITFPGFMWRANITMPIEKVLFSRSVPSAQGVGSHQLEIIRPDKSYSLYLFSMGNTCYQDLSFFLWYMDKNRPLPPGTAFDPYRNADYERRKAAGFPKPMFPASFETLEATPEQQAERNRIGGW